MHLKAPLLITALSISISLTNCGPKNKFSPPPPAVVTVAHPLQRDQVVYEQYPASLVGVSVVEIRARVRGELDNVYFAEGKLVKKGDQLFSIEPDIYNANKAGATADVEQAKAGLRLATANLARLSKAGPRAVSELDLERARADVDKAKAIVKQSEAQLQSATIDLSYTTIDSPIAGRTSRTMVDIGNLVGNGDPTLLTTVVDESSIRAYYEVPERTMLQYYRARSENKDLRKTLNRVNLTLADGSLYEHLGTIDYIDNQVNTGTRTAQVRAVFPNPDGMLSSGLFAEVGYPRTFEDALLVPSIALLNDIGGSFVWVVEDDNKVARRSVVTGPSVYRPQADDSAVPIRDTLILKGLEASDRVVTRGVQRVREQAIVAPQMEDNEQQSETSESPSKQLGN